jgi:hypothetical protein
MAEDEKNDSDGYGSVASMYAAQYKYAPDPADPMLVTSSNSSTAGHYGGLPEHSSAPAARPRAAPRVVPGVKYGYYYQHYFQGFLH